MSKKIKKNDVVLAIIGKDKGRSGKVLKVYKEGKVVVEGVNVVKKCVKGNPSKGIESAIVEKNAPIHISNVVLINPSTGKGSRVGYKLLEDGKKVRIFKSDGSIVVEKQE